MVPPAIQVSDRADRQRAQLQAMAAITVVGLVDLAVSGGLERLTIWAGWLALFGLSAAVITRGPAVVAVVCGAATALGSVIAFFALILLGGGPASPYFLVVTVVPLLMAVAAPSDLLDAGLVGVTVLVGGTWVQVRFGRSLADVARWDAMVVVTTAFALVAAVRHRRQQARQLEDQVRQAGMLERLAAAERASALAERWATIGRVADAVAHDVNSPLGALRSNLGYAREELAAGRLEEIDDALVDSQGGVERIREIVASLQAFSRSDAEDAEARALEAEDGARGLAPTPAPSNSSPPR
jgi:signal transduction histidine kinase